MDKYENNNNVAKMLVQQINNQKRNTKKYSYLDNISLHY